METLRGNLTVKNTNKNDFVFQTLEWIGEDIEEEDDGRGVHGLFK